MSKALDRAVKRVKALPRDKQAVAAELLGDVAHIQDDGIYVLSASEERLISEGLVELDRGESVSHAEIKALLAKYRA